MTELQKELRSGITPEQLKEKYFISFKTHLNYPSLYLFKYNQIDSPMALKICQESRGIILDRDNNWGIVSCPFFKFFNVEEGHAAKIDWDSARVLSKLDGSLCCLYYYDNKWHVSTSGTPDASGMVNVYDKTFKELFWQVFTESGYNLNNLVRCTGFTFMFELCTPYNRVVVPHTDNKLILIGARDNKTLKEFDIDYFGGIFETVKEHEHLNDLKSLVESFKDLDGFRNEGYVVIDKDFNRVKVKHPAYIEFHHMRDGLSTKSMLELIRTNEGSEFLSYFPEFSEEYYKLQTSYQTLVNDLKTVYEQHKGIASQKEFALAIKDCRLNGALFSLRAGKIDSIEQGLSKIQIDRLMETLK